MRIRNIIFAFLTLALTACVAPEQQPDSTGPASWEAASGPLAIQSSVAWPPKAVSNQSEGSVSDYKGNQICLGCHGYILEAKSARGDIVNLHRRHLESKKTAYEGKNRDCLTCHEMWTPTKNASEKEGWFVMADVYHPNSARSPDGVWKKLIVRAGVTPNFTTVEALRPAEPYIYKPTLKQLVCVECHGPDSKIKTFYGAPQAAK